MSTVVPFDPSRRRSLGLNLRPYKPRQDAELAPLWIDGEISLLQFLEGLKAAGLELTDKGGGKGFVIAKREAR